MAKTVKRVRFLSDSFDRGELRYARGQHYALCPDSLAQVLVHGNAELVQLEVDAEQHRQETDAAHARWNVSNGRTISADVSLRDETNAAAALVQARLAELAARQAK